MSTESASTASPGTSPDLPLDPGALRPLLSRRSVSPKRLIAPGPDLAALDLILQAALAAPDHGGLHPWRVIEFRAEHRGALAALFEQEKLRRDPLAAPAAAADRLVVLAGDEGVGAPARIS